MSSSSKEETYPLCASGSPGYGSTKVSAPTDKSSTELVYSRHQVLGAFVSAVVASLPAFLVGVTLGFSSSALLDLDELEPRPEYKFNYILSDIYGVGHTHSRLNIVV